MGQETELKLLVSGDVQSLLESAFIENTEATVTRSRFQLFNQYFDTPEKALRQAEIGFRVRGRDGAYEQTVKTAGKVVGGLHKRPEYNVQLSGSQPDLGLFDPDIWPEGVNVSRMQAQLKELFTTDFTRSEYRLTYSDGCTIELVYDRGEISADGNSEEINEIELELVSGEPLRLFDVAAQLADVMPVRLGNLSKAARGYMLAENRPLKLRSLDSFLPVNNDDSCEKGFICALEYALSFLQHNETCYLRSGKTKDLKGILEGMGLLLQAVTLYLPFLQCADLLQIHRALLNRYRKLFWFEQLIAIKELRAKRGQYRKKLAKNEPLISYLFGLSAGIRRDHDPHDWLTESSHGKLQLAIARLILEKPWQGESSSYTSALEEHAKGWLSQGWQNVLQSMPINKQMTAQEYMAQQSLLRQTMYNGFLLGALFAEQREQFRAPWLDILDGIDELKTLQYLEVQLVNSDLADKGELQLWCQGKINSLLAVMEQSRKVGLSMEAYW